MTLMCRMIFTKIGAAPQVPILLLLLLMAGCRIRAEASYRCLLWSASGAVMIEPHKAGK